MKQTFAFRDIQTAQFPDCLKIPIMVLDYLIYLDFGRF